MFPPSKRGSSLIKVRFRLHGNNTAKRSRAAVEALKDYVFALADGFLVTVCAANEYEAARTAREQYIRCLS